MDIKQFPLLEKKADEITEKLKNVQPKLTAMFKQCFLNTIETTVQELSDGSTFVITGDIPAMWLRDSAAQVRPYLKYAKDDPKLLKTLKGVVEKHIAYVATDPYANAFNSEKIGFHYKDTTDFVSPYVWERKYETDSLCASIYLAHDYLEYTGDDSILTDGLLKMLHTIADIFKLEQRHENSKYFFEREDCPETDTLCCGGRGKPVGYTGMTWSGFRPSDDACVYNYLIPSEMMACVAMKYAVDIAKTMKDGALCDKCSALQKEIQEGIEKFGIVEHPKYGKIYAYETDGLGNYLLMDDANSPSLLAAPYLEYCEKTDEIYQNTRRFIFSKDNPFYCEGKYATGVGSPHVPKNYIWHISLVMQALTSIDKAEIDKCVDTISKTTAGTNYMHEGFDVDNPNNYTREWFAWANTIFAQMAEELTEE